WLVRAKYPQRRVGNRAANAAQRGQTLRCAVRAWLTGRKQNHAPLAQVQPLAQRGERGLGRDAVRLDSIVDDLERLQAVGHQRLPERITDRDLGVGVVVHRMPYREVARWVPTQPRVLPVGNNRQAVVNLRATIRADLWCAICKGKRVARGEDGPRANAAPQYDAVIAEVRLHVVRVDDVRFQRPQRAIEWDDRLRVQQSVPRRPARGVARVQQVDGDAAALLDLRRAGRGGDERHAVTGSDQPLTE